MKIGILTFHSAHNYGAVLQCYALQEYLKSLGHDVEVIDYRPKYLLDTYKVFKASKTGTLSYIIKSFIKALLILRRSYIRYNKFNNFTNNHLNLSYPKNYISDKYDIYIIGSDQVWNPDITNGFDPIYFAEFSFEKGSKIYASYAASMEAKEISKNNINFCKKHLDNFDYISVRENTLAELIQPLSLKKVYTVLDPTFLVDKNVWDNITVKPKNAKKYVLIYQLGENKKTVLAANEIAKKIDAEVIVITCITEWRYNKNYKTAISPEEFLGLFKYASFIITTSFHGTVFSLINNKPFLYFKDNGESLRVKSLLSQLDMENNIVRNYNSLNLDNIDYVNINKKIDVLKKYSKEYIKLLLRNE